MNFAHIVFLDFDGPLFPEKALLLAENNENSDELKELGLHPMVTYWKMEPCIIAMLNQLYELRPFFIVVSSSWGEFHSKEQIERLLAYNGLNIPLHSDWKLMTEGEGKAKKIASWFADKKIADYMIVDDDESGEEFSQFINLEKNRLDNKRILLLSHENGATMSDYFKMQAIVANWS